MSQQMQARYNDAHNRQIDIPTTTLDDDDDDDDFDENESNTTDELIDSYTNTNNNNKNSLTTTANANPNNNKAHPNNNNNRDRNRSMSSSSSSTRDDVEESRGDISTIDAFEDAFGALTANPWKLSASAIFGACAAVAAKRLAHNALYNVGLGVIGLQCLSYMGYIQIHWNRINETFVKHLDANGDGVVDQQDLRTLANTGMGVLKHNMPDAAGFTSGFALGFKMLD